MIRDLQPIVIAAWYKFVRLLERAQLQADLQAFCTEQGLKGTILLAPEGINGTVAGTRRGIDALSFLLRHRFSFAGMEWKEATADVQPFHRMKVRLKREIVTMGVADVDPVRNAGDYVAPKDWNALISDPQITLVDVRNRYEVYLGSFVGAIDPAIESFRDFPGWESEALNVGRDKKVAMFCTGGIRCEKASAYLRSRGYAQVYQLKGGILGYLQEVREPESLWRGECFVFDNRVTVDHCLQPGSHEVCFNCRMPLSSADKQTPQYEKHVSCPHCIERVDTARRSSLLERKRQIELATARGELHIGKRFPEGDL